VETKQIVDEFLSKKNNSSIWNSLFKEELYDCENEFNKTIFNFNADDLLKFFSLLKINGENMRNMAQISVIKSKYNNFFDWCIKNGYSDRNPIAENNKLLSDMAILSYIKPDNKILYTPDEMNDIFVRLRGSFYLIYLEGIIRALYEGVPSVMKFIELKYTDLDIRKNILDLGDYKLPISNELKDILVGVHEMQSVTILGASGVREIKYRLEDLYGSLYKFPTKPNKNVWKNDRNTYYTIAKSIHSSRFSEIERIIGSEINEEILRNSYLFKILFDYMGGDIEKIRNLIKEDNIVSANVNIDIIMARTNCQYRANDVRRRLIPYFLNN